MKIQEMKTKESSGGYERVFNCKELGILLSKVQATVISNGTELERMILSQSTVIENLDDFISATEENKTENGIYVAPKKIVKESKRTVKGIEPDLVIFIVEHKRVCKIIEVKDGFMFDTKKVKGEKQNLEFFATQFGSRIPFSTDYYICCFNETDKGRIREGLKNEFELEHIMTGVELCDILKISYIDIRKKRIQDSENNIDYFVSELLKIDTVRNKISNLLTK